MPVGCRFYACKGSRFNACKGSRLNALTSERLELAKVLIMALA
jgi:hypothetical protein